jgi:hypothetical protein
MDVLATMAAERGSMVLVTERTREVGPMICEGCDARHPGGRAHGVIVQEHDATDAHWRLWVLPDGFSVSDESAKGPMASCPSCQAVPVVRVLRFAPAIPALEDAR